MLLILALFSFFSALGNLAAVAILARSRRDPTRPYITFSLLLGLAVILGGVHFARTFL